MVQIYDIFVSYVMYFQALLALHTNFGVWDMVLVKIVGFIVLKVFSNYFSM